MIPGHGAPGGPELVTHTAGLVEAVTVGQATLPNDGSSSTTGAPLPAFTRGSRHRSERAPYPGSSSGTGPQST